MTRRIAVLTGKAGVGKTTIANLLVDKHNFVRIRFAGPLKAMCAALGLSHDEIEGHLKDVPCAKLTWAKADDLLKNLEGAFKALGVTSAEMRSATGDDPVALLGGRGLKYATLTLLHVILLCVSKGGLEGATPRSLMQMIGTEWGRALIDKDLWTRAWRQRVGGTPEHLHVVVDDCRFPNEQDAASDAGNAMFFRVLRDVPTKLAGSVEQAHESEAHDLWFDAIVENNSVPEAAAARTWRLFEGRFGEEVPVDTGVLAGAGVGSGP